MSARRGPAGRFFILLGSGTDKVGCAVRTGKSIQIHGAHGAPYIGTAWRTGKNIQIHGAHGAPYIGTAWCTLHLLHYLNALISPASLAAIITITVLRRTATHLIRRVLFLVQFDLGVDGLFHIDAEFVGEANKVDLDIGNFLFYLGELFGGQGLALVFCKPLEVFDQFGGLDDQCHGEVLRRVELVPVALTGEFTQAVFYMFE